MDGATDDPYGIHSIRQVSANGTAVPRAHHREEPMNRFLITALILTTSITVAQAGTTGKISGRVTSEIGDPLASANVVVQGTSLGAMADMEGYFFILNVPPGTYRIAASYIGYETVIQTDVLVRVDRTVQLDFVLAQEALAVDAIVITAERPVVERDITSTVKNIGADEIESIPVTTVSDVLELQTGVVRTGGALHVRGGRSGELAYMIDGHRIEDPVMGDVPTDINKDAVQQVELITGTFNAEYGNAMSGVVNIVTKENLWDYQGNVTYRTTALGLEDASDNFGEQYVEGYVSGPLPGVKNAGFLLSGRIIEEDSYFESGVLGSDGQPTGELSGEPFGYDNRNNVFGKIILRPFETGKLSFSYNYDDREWQGYDHDYKYIPDSAYVRTRESNLLSAVFTHTPSNNLFYEIRGSFYDFDFLQNYAGYDYTEYSAGTGERDDDDEFYLSAANQEYEDEHVQTITAKADLNWQANRFHLIKAGAEFKQHSLDYFSIFGPTRTAANQYVDDYELEPYEGAFYVQDKVEFETLIVNAGLRFDFYDPSVENYVEDPNHPDESIRSSETKTQFSPRVGVSYPVTEKSVFHFAYGHFFQRPNYDVMYEDLSRKLTVSYPLIGDPDLEPEQTISYEFGLHTTFLEGTSVQTTVFSRKIRNLIGVVWQFKEEGIPVPYSYYTNEDFAYVKGFEINFRGRRGPLGFGANYTYQIAEGSSSSQDSRYLGAHEIAGRQSLQFYPLTFDQRHTVNAHVTASFGEDEGPFGFLPVIFQHMRTAVLFEYGSGLPYTYNPTRSRYEPDLNNARMPDVYTFDLEIDKRLLTEPLDVALNIEIYNLFDRENVIDVYGVTGEPDYSGPFTPFSNEYDSDPENYGNPRTIYCGLRVGF